MKWTIALITCLLMMSSADAQQLTPKQMSEIKIDQKLDAQVPLDAQFRDESGQPVRLGEYFGSKPVILTLVYYECPMLCTQVLNGLVGALTPLAFNVGQEFDIVTVSIDPTESPELAARKKRDYLARYHREGAENGWHFLTGSKESIASLASTVGFRYVYDSVSKQFAHASGIMVLTPKGKVAAYQFGVDYSPKDLRLSLVDASQEKIGSVIDQLTLLCYQYDPLTGKYGMTIRGVLEIAAAATVLILGGAVFFWLRRERRHAKLDVHAPASRNGVS